MSESNSGEKQKLDGANFEFGPTQNVLISDDANKWELSLNIDLTAEELIFNVDMEPLYWLAVGLAPDLIEADVIYWTAGSTN